jgi:hypothetical protein
MKTVIIFSNLTGEVIAEVQKAKIFRLIDPQVKEAIENTHMNLTDLGVKEYWATGFCKDFETAAEYLAQKAV